MGEVMNRRNKYALGELQRGIGYALRKAKIV
jgi:hypothetical protein